MKYALTCAMLVTAFFSNNVFAGNSEIEELKARMKAVQDRIQHLENENKSVDPSDLNRVTKSTRTKARTATGENSGNPSISMVGNFTGQRIHGSGGVHSSSFLPLSEAEFIFGNRPAC